MMALPVQADWQMHKVSSFKAVGEQAQAANIPMVIFFSRVRCGACDRLKENALLPLVENGLLDGYVEIIEIQANADETVLDFDGVSVPNSEMAELYNVSTFPNMVFTDGSGEDLEIRMNNSGAYDYFSFYFKERINGALAKLDNPKRIE
jgi:thioredoxin-related protein